MLNVLITVYAPTMKNIWHFILFLDQSQNLGMNNDEEWRPRRRGSQL